MKLYTSDGRSYDGMEEEVVRGLLDEMGLTAVTFVTQKEYEIYVEAHQPPPPPSPAPGTSVDERLAMLETKVQVLETKVP